MIDDTDEMAAGFGAALAWRVELADSSYLIDDIDDAQAVDDLTNHGAKLVPLYPAQPCEKRAEATLSQALGNAVFWQERTEAAEKRAEAYKTIAAGKERQLATVEAETIERCAKVCERYQLWKLAREMRIIGGEGALKGANK